LWCWELNPGAQEFLRQVFYQGAPPTTWEKSVLKEAFSILLSDVFFISNNILNNSICKILIVSWISSFFSNHTAENLLKHLCFGYANLWTNYKHWARYCIQECTLGIPTLIKL
jgi:hypothetical protein